MRTWATAVIATLLGFVFSACILAQNATHSTATTTGGATPDLTGVWVSARMPPIKNEVAPEDDWADEFTYLHSPYPMQPWAADKFAYNRDPVSPYRAGRNELNPTLANCTPQGPTIDWLFQNFPFEIIQNPKRVMIFYERGHEVRQIWTDGREHPKDWGHTWMGHSIGHWEGGTLVVDTMGLNDITWLDHAGHVHTDALHLIEKLQRVDHDTLLLNITFDDPKAFTKPFSARKKFQLKPTWEIGEDTICEDRLIGEPIPLR